MPHLSTEQFDDFIILRLHANLIDPLTINQVGDQLLDAIDGARNRSVLLDLSSITAVSSEMLGKLIQAQKKCAAAGTQFNLCGISTELQNILHTMRLDLYFNIHKDTQHAIEAFVP